MIGNNPTQLIGLVGNAVMGEDYQAINNIRVNFCTDRGLRDPMQSIEVILGEIDGNIAYTCGFLGPELGTKALKMFGVKHPYFGDRIPDQNEAYDAGRKLAKEYAAAEQTKSEAIRKAKKAAELGVMVPDSDEAVTSDDADALLKALRIKREQKEALEKAAQFQTLADVMRVNEKPLKAAVMPRLEDLIEAKAKLVAAASAL